MVGPTVDAARTRPSPRANRPNRRAGDHVRRAIGSAGSPPPGVAPETLRARWRLAFDAAQGALDASRQILPADELAVRAQRLAAERVSTAGLLQDFARNTLVTPRFEVSVLPPLDARRLLGLPPEVVACVFNLDGVLIGSATIHAEAWAKTFDDFLSRRSDRTHRDVAPFDPHVDYRTHLHGRPRLDGVRAFLASRGISLPEGRAGDEPGAETVHGLANRKNALLGRLLEQRELHAYQGAREYLAIAHDAHVRCAVVSASANTEAVLERSGLTSLVDARIDGTRIVAERLLPRPAPDILLAACDDLSARPRQTAVFETTSAGIEAARAAGFGLVIGVGRGDRTEELRRAGADLVVGGLEDVSERAQAA
jgi:HAD superfamily hydrolase (TIGR01509 family)